MTYNLINSSQWKQKAMAFVTRSHRHLWGKNNEDPLAFLFTCGLKNTFIKEMLLGWNKFGQNRPIENWGLLQKKDKDEKLFLAPGLVIPFIEKKQLKSVFIHSYHENKPGITTMLPGSAGPTMILGDLNQKLALVHNLLDGLYLFQEAGKACSVMIHPDPYFQMDFTFLKRLKMTQTLHVFSLKEDLSPFQIDHVSDFPTHIFHTYNSRHELVERMLDEI